MSDGSLTPFTQGMVSYTVLGYHTVEANDPLYLDTKYVSYQTFADRLIRCGLDINNAISDTDAAWLRITASQTSKNMRTLVHGTLLELPWSQSPVEGKKTLPFLESYAPDV